MVAAAEFKTIGIEETIGGVEEVARPERYAWRQMEGSAAGSWIVEQPADGFAHPIDRDDVSALMAIHSEPQWDVTASVGARSTA